MDVWYDMDAHSYINKQVTITCTQYLNLNYICLYLRVLHDCTNSPSPYFLWQMAFDVSQLYMYLWERDWFFFCYCSCGLKFSVWEFYKFYQLI